jgi:hypothetical protein
MDSLHYRYELDSGASRAPNLHNNSIHPPQDELVVTSAVGIVESVVTTIVTFCATLNASVAVTTGFTNNTMFGILDPPSTLKSEASCLAYGSCDCLTRLHSFIGKQNLVGRNLFNDLGETTGGLFWTMNNNVLSPTQEESTKYFSILVQ